MSKNIIDFPVILTYHKKDQYTIKYCIENVRKNLIFKEIIVLSSIKNQSFIESLGCKFINENIIGKKNVDNFLNLKNGGWYLQQVLKFYISEIIEYEYYLVLDSDTVLLNSISFFKNDKPCYSISDKTFSQYSNGNEFLLGKKIDIDFSFISHHMIFKTQIVKKIMSEITQNKGKSWILSILDICKKNNKDIAFSEFETYGNYLLQNNIELNLRTIKTIDIPLKPSKFWISLYSLRFKMVSFHKYSWSADSNIRKALKCIKYFFIPFLAKN